MTKWNDEEDYFYVNETNGEQKKNPDFRANQIKLPSNWFMRSSEAIKYPNWEVSHYLFIYMW